MTRHLNCDCGARLPFGVCNCPKCNKEITHRDWYPEQYRHPLVGKKVNVKTGTGHEMSGVVVRVVQSRFGALAHLDTSGRTAYLVNDCRPSS